MVKGPTSNKVTDVNVNTKNGVRPIRLTEQQAADLQN
jgi:hypothetical protein